MTVVSKIRLMEMTRNEWEGTRRLQNQWWANQKIGKMDSFVTLNYTRFAWDIAYVICSNIIKNFLALFTFTKSTFPFFFVFISTSISTKAAIKAHFLLQSSEWKIKYLRSSLMVVKIAFLFYIHFSLFLFLAHGRLC